jgi:hypothetical protein
MSKISLVRALLVLLVHLVTSANGSHYLFKREYHAVDESSTIPHSAAAPRVRRVSMPATTTKSRTKEVRANNQEKKSRKLSKEGKKSHKKSKKSKSESANWVVLKPGGSDTPKYAIPWDGHHQDVHYTTPKAEDNNEKYFTMKQEKGTISVKDLSKINKQQLASTTHSPESLSPANLPGKGGIDSSIATIGAHDQGEPINAGTTSTTAARDSIQESKSHQHVQRSKEGMILSSGNEKNFTTSDEDPRPNADNAIRDKSFNGRDSGANVSSIISSTSPAFGTRQASLWCTLSTAGLALFVGLLLFA